MKNINPDIYRNYERLVEIKIKGKCYRVPENNCTLRAFQFIEADFTMSRFCWNAECENCLIKFREGNSGIDKTALACQQETFDGMVITQLPSGISL
ncbi:MAG: hypothetical protein OEV42_01135 [Deltaproteobacteria bacterium]|nr:hypothetical protein [Deltaproteobacteria bacterium]